MTLGYMRSIKSTSQVGFITSMFSTCFSASEMQFSRREQSGKHLASSMLRDTRTLTLDRIKAVAEISQENCHSLFLFASLRVTRYPQRTTPWEFLI